MDAAKKVTIEKRIVIGLVVLFVVSFIMGPLRSLGLFGQRARGAEELLSAEAVNVAKPVGAMLRQHWQQWIPPSEPETPARSADAPQAPAAYTAGELRDPLKSLLPQPAAQQGQGEVSSVPLEQAHPSSPSPPPALRVQGLLWGVPEPRAIINDAVYGVDEMVEGAKILSIDRRGVTVDHLGRPVLYPPASTGQEAGGPRPQRVHSSQQARQWR
jgi:hypothetical protein